MSITSQLKPTDNGLLPVFPMRQQSTLALGLTRQSFGPSATSATSEARIATTAAPMPIASVNTQSSTNSKKFVRDGLSEAKSAETSHSGAATKVAPSPISPTANQTESAIGVKAPEATKKKRGRITAEWDTNSDNILLEMRAKGATWNDIAKRIGREPATCLHRYESTLNPALAQFWTDEKMRQLDQLVTSGKSWADIGRIMGVHRLACKEKWRLMGQAELEVQQQTVVEWAEVKKQLKLKQQEEQQQQQQQQQARLAENYHEIDLKSWNELLRDEARYEHHRSWKKVSVSDSFSKLYLMNAGWAAKEEAILIQHVLKNGIHQWEEASVALNGRFSAEECRSCWKNLDMPVAMPEGDLEEKMQDSALVGLGEESRVTPAAEDTATTPVKREQTRKAVETGTLQAGQLHEWTSDQQVHFWYLWREYGEDWVAISRGLGDRPPSACKAYFNKITSIVRDRQEGIDTDSDGVEDGVRSSHLQARDESEASGEALRLAKAITRNFTRRWKQAKAQIPKPNASAEIVVAGKKPWQPFVWTKARSVRMQAVMRQAYRHRKGIKLEDINWSWLARNVHPDVTGRVCRNHWKYLHSMDAQWTQEDIRQLEEGIRLVGPRKLATVREHFLPHMTKDDVIRQWFKISDKATTITEEEYYTLLAAVEMHGTEQWDLVEAEMPAGWKRPPCKRVWESSFQHLMAKANWTESEDKQLLKMVEATGYDDWFAVAKAMPGQRTAWEVRLRWCQLIDPIKLDSQNITVGGQPVRAAVESI
ncbi:hypothetical protein BGW41_005418 [Actinomortierella wolfii]|nr:hypothetical protein BGW41_005418 [Actinomortierella wolfii]